MKYITFATIILIFLGQAFLIIGKATGLINISWLLAFGPILVIGAIDFCLVVALLISGILLNALVILSISLSLSISVTLSFILLTYNSFKV